MGALQAGDAGEDGSKTEVLALGDPPARGDSRKIEDDGSGAQQILAREVNPQVHAQLLEQLKAKL